MANPTPDIRSGVLKSFNSGTYVATVLLTGSLQQYVTVPTARDIAAAEMVAERKVAVAFFDPANQGDACLLAVWT